MVASEQPKQRWRSSGGSGSGGVSREERSRIRSIAASGCLAEGGAQGNIDPGLGSHVVEDSAGHRDLESLLDEEPLGAELDGVVLPEGELAVVVLGRRGPLGLHGPDHSVCFLEDVELGGDPELLRAERDAAGAEGVSLLPGPAGERGVVDTPVLEETVLDVLVGRHDRLDIFQVVEPRTVADLVQGADGINSSADSLIDSSFAKRDRGRALLGRFAWSHVQGSRRRGLVSGFFPGDRSGQRLSGPKRPSRSTPLVLTPRTRPPSTSPSARSSAGRSRGAGGSRCRRAGVR